MFPPGGACPRGYPGACRHTETCLYIGWYTQVFPKFFIKFFVRDLSEVLRTRCSLFRQGITTKNHTTISSISNGVYPKKRDIRRESTGATGGWPYVSLSSLVLSTYLSLMGYRRMPTASPWITTFIDSCVKPWIVLWLYSTVTWTIPLG